jgi:hypothetical protein
MPAGCSLAWNTDFEPVCGVCRLVLLLFGVGWNADGMLGAGSHGALLGPEGAGAFSVAIGPPAFLVVGGFGGWLRYGPVAL